MNVYPKRLISGNDYDRIMKECGVTFAVVYNASKADYVFKDAAMTQPVSATGDYVEAIKPFYQFNFNKPLTRDTTRDKAIWVKGRGIEIDVMNPNGLGADYFVTVTPDTGRHFIGGQWVASVYAGGRAWKNIPPWMGTKYNGTISAVNSGTARMNTRSGNAYYFNMQNGNAGYGQLQTGITSGNPALLYGDNVNTTSWVGIIKGNTNIGFLRSNFYANGPRNSTGPTYNSVCMDTGDLTSDGIGVNPQNHWYINASFWVMDMQGDEYQFCKVSRVLNTLANDIRGA